jgi:two-component system, LytTR family, sensor kinase
LKAEIAHIDIQSMDSKTLRQIARAYLASAGIWCGLSLLTGWQYRIFDQELNLPSSLLDMVLLAEARGFTLALLTPPIFFLVRRHKNGTSHWFRYAGAFLVGLLPFMILYACIHWLLLPPWDPVLQRYVPRNGHGPLELIRTGFADQITMYIAIVVAAHAYKYFERSRRQELERAEYQRELAASELQALKAQLHPHFLFNTLHGIATLIDNERQNAKAMLVRLSSLLRKALEHNGSDLVTLHDEMNFIREYLDIEKMRLGARLNVVLSIDTETEKFLIPQMLLQPLVENAIRYGAAARREGGFIEISSHRGNGNFEVCIRNSVGKKASGTGVGLRNTEARLRHLYSGDAIFSFAISGEQTATARLVLPALGSIEPARGGDGRASDAIGDLGTKHARAGR